MKKLQKGFTLIELLVVIAIIGILSSVVLASLTSARSKGQDSAIQASLSNMRAQAELFYGNNSNTYKPIAGDANDCTAGIFAGTTAASTTMKTLVDGAESQNGSNSLSCRVGANFWAVSSPLSSGHFCVDSKGNAIATSSALATGHTACN